MRSTACGAASVRGASSSTERPRPGRASRQGALEHARRHTVPGCALRSIRSHPASATAAPPPRSSRASTSRTRLAIVTGGYSGIGLETVRALTGAGAHVVVPARRRATAEEALAGIAGVEIDELDLGDQESVHAFAERFLATGRSIDLLINNAGIMALPETRVGPGFEAQLATNHLGHFTLTNLLWPRLVAAGARASSRSRRAGTSARASASTISCSNAATTGGRRTGSRRPRTSSSPSSSTRSGRTSAYARSPSTPDRS